MTTYKNTKIVRTDVVCLNNNRRLYALEGDVSKPAAQRPFLTTVAEAKAFISSRADFSGYAE